MRKKNRTNSSRSQRNAFIMPGFTRLKHLIRKKVDYSRFSLSRINAPEFRHLKYLFFWPVFGIVFFIIERVWIRDYYTPIHCPLDDVIPFCEYFLPAYLFWFVFLIGFQIYTLLYDPESFERFMKFIILSYSAAVILYIVFPNCQELRPVTFPRDNVLTSFMADFYQFDTNTNVFPSIHVIGSLAVMLCGWNSKDLCTTGWRIFLSSSTLFITLSTLFLKQHSVLDVVAALLICALVYRLVCSSHCSGNHSQQEQHVSRCVHISDKRT